ncbi:MAG: hypothetical protein ACXVKO_09070 [Bacteriovorax sp.]
MPFKYIRRAFRFSLSSFTILEFEREDKKMISFYMLLKAVKKIITDVSKKYPSLQVPINNF